LESIEQEKFLLALLSLHRQGVNNAWSLIGVFLRVKTKKKTNMNIQNKHKHTKQNMTKQTKHFHITKNTESFGYSSNVI